MEVPVDTLTAFCDEYMEMGMKIEPGPKVWMTAMMPGLSSCPETVDRYFTSARTEAEVIGELAVEAEKYPQHLGDGKDDLTMANIPQKFLPAVEVFVAHFLNDRTEISVLSLKT